MVVPPYCGGVMVNRGRVFYRHLCSNLSLSFTEKPEYVSMIQGQRHTKIFGPFYSSTLTLHETPPHSSSYHTDCKIDTMSGFPGRRGSFGHFERSPSAPDKIKAKRAQIISTVDGQFDSDGEGEGGQHAVGSPHDGRITVTSPPGFPGHQTSWHISGTAAVVSHQSQSTTSTAGLKSLSTSLSDGATVDTHNSHPTTSTASSTSHSTWSSDGSQSRTLPSSRLSVWKKNAFSIQKQGTGQSLPSPYDLSLEGLVIPEDSSMPLISGLPQNVGNMDTSDDLFSSSLYQNLLHSAKTEASSVSELSGHSTYPGNRGSQGDSVTTSKLPALASDVVKPSPRLPQCKLSGQPKSELYVLYGQRHGRVLKTGDYITWNDNGPPHNLRFTSVFVCPVTGEAFRSGTYGSAVEMKNGLCWYVSKKMAEHGAAARAYDCLSFREARHGEAYYYLGDDEPYPKEARRPVTPTGIPHRAWSLIVEAQKRAPEFSSDEEMEFDLFGT